jgi:hypothetical protein
MDAQKKIKIKSFGEEINVLKEKVKQIDGLKEKVSLTFSLRTSICLTFSFNMLIYVLKQTVKELEKTIKNLENNKKKETIINILKCKKHELNFETRRDLKDHEYRP